jgi:hypothetical protein
MSQQVFVICRGGDEVRLRAAPFVFFVDHDVHVHPFDPLQTSAVPGEFTMQPKEVVSLGLFWSEWSRCLTAKYQRDQLYRFGKFDDCSPQFKDFKTAMKAKFTKEEKDAREMIEGTFYHKRNTVSPTVGVIWELKETPGW